MGSRSKTRSVRATSPGRAILKVKRGKVIKPRKPLVIRFGDALQDLINTNAPAHQHTTNRNRRRRGKKAIDLPTLSAAKATP